MLAQCASPTWVLALPINGVECLICSKCCKKALGSCRLGASKYRKTFGLVVPLGMRIPER